MAPKIGPKSVKYRGCVADAFLEGLGAALGGKSGHRTGPRPSIFGTIFGQKSKKWHPKTHSKIDAEKVLNNDAKSSKNDSKIYIKFTIFHTFSKKAKMRTNIEKGTKRELGDIV